MNLSPQSMSSEGAALGPTVPGTSPSENGDPTPDWANGVALGFCLFHLIWHPFVLLAALFNTWVLIRNGQFLHPNLRILLVAQSATIALYELMSTALILAKLIVLNMFYAGPIPLQWAAMFALNLSAHLGNFLCVERIFATIRAKTYEKRQRPFLGVFFVVNGIVASAINTAMVMGGNGSFGRSAFVIVTGVLTIVFSCKQILIFWGIKRYNKKMYEKMIDKISESSDNRQNYLSEKFQRSENIRTSRQLMPAIIYHFMGSVVFNSNNIATSLALVQTVYAQNLLWLSECLFYSITHLCIEITVITHHPMLKRRGLELLEIVFAPLCRFGQTAQVAPATPDVASSSSIVEQEQNSVGGNGNNTINNQNPKKSKARESRIQCSKSLQTLFGETLIDDNNHEDHFIVLESYWDPDELGRKEAAKQKIRSKADENVLGGAPSKVSRMSKPN